MLRNLWVLRGKEQALLRGLACSSACSSTATAARDLLQQPDQLTSPSQLNPTELESLAFILGLKEDMYRAFAQRGPEEYASAVLSRLEPAHKQALVQKLLAASGTEATPALLAWANEQIIAAVKAAIKEGSVSQPWYPELLALAQAWQARRSAGSQAATITELQCIQNMLETPGALRWEDWLGLPNLDALLQHVCSAVQPTSLLGTILQHLGIAPQDATQQDQGTKAVPALAYLTTLSTNIAQLQHTLKRDLASALGLQTPNASLPANLVSQGVKQAAAAPDGPVALLLLQLKVLEHVKLSLGIPPAGHVTALLRVLRCPRGHSLTGVQQPSVDTSQLQATGTLLQRVAATKQLSLADVLGWSCAQLQHELSRAASEDKAVSSMLSSVQVWRCALLVAGDPWLLSSATRNDMDTLTPEQFNKLNRHAQTQNSVGSQLYSRVFASAPPSQPTQHATSHTALDPETVSVIHALPLQDRAALAWVILRSSGLATTTTTTTTITTTTTTTDTTSSQGAQTGASAEWPVVALLQAFARHALCVHKHTSTAHTAVQDLAALVRLERQMAAMDLLHDRSPPPFRLPDESNQASSPAELPTQEQLQAARAQLPESQLLLFDLLHQDLTAGIQVPDRHLVAAFNALLSPQSAVRPEQLLDAGDINLPTSATEWLSQSKQQLVALPPATLAMLSRFLQLRVQASKAAATEAQQRLKALLVEVQAAAAQAAATATSGDSEGRISPYWASTRSPRSNDRSSDVLSASGDLPSPEVVTALLGPQEGAQFEAWLKARALADLGQQGVQPYELLDETHEEMDRLRYLTMEHDPQLHVVWETAPRPWSEPGPLTSPDQFLEHMKPLLNKYLDARGLPPVLEAEWQVYAEAALAEFADTREAHEAALRSQGHSTFFNSRAESVYLRQLLAEGIPPGAPLHEQAERYLGVLEANPSWTFAQRKRVVKRLIELSQHFKAHPPSVAQQGSPFAALFTGQAPLVPCLISWHESAADSTSPVPAG